MRKQFALLLFTLSASLPAFADGYDGNAPLIKGDSWKWLNMNLVMFVLGIIIFAAIIRRIFDARQAKQKTAPAGQSGHKDNIYEPRFWYQCKNCRLTVRKDSPPNTADCFQAVDHRWTQLAEVGKVKYLCKNCNTLIEAKAQPVSENCPEAEYHNWEQLS